MVLGFRGKRDDAVAFTQTIWSTAFCHVQVFAGLSLVVRASFWLKKAHAAQEVPEYVIAYS